MAKKQNGFGSAGSFAFKGVDNRTDKNKKQGAFGSYPSNRRYGTSVQRTVIEQYNLDSDWSRWRKGIRVLQPRCIPTVYPARYGDVSGNRG